MTSFEKYNHPLCARLLVPLAFLFLFILCPFECRESISELLPFTARSKLIAHKVSL